MNSGFMYVRPTPGGVRFLAMALRIARGGKGIRQQPAVNQAVEQLNHSGLLKYSVIVDACGPCVVFWRVVVTRMASRCLE